LSLKGFHVVFVAAALALTGWLGWWAWQTGRTGWVAAAAAAAVGLVVSGVWFLRKMRGVSYL
jgi:hypothetical protein